MNIIWHSIADLVVVVAARTSMMDSKRMSQMEYCRCKVQVSQRGKSVKGYIKLKIHAISLSHSIEGATMKASRKQRVNALI